MSLRFYRRQKTTLVLCACTLVGALLLLGIAKKAVGTWSHEDPEPLPLHWNVNVADRKPDEVHHILFVKVHKAASSTLTSIFIRFSLARKLNVMLPRPKHNILSERWRWPLARLAEHPPSPPFLFDILCNHVVYDPRLEQFLPQDVVHVTILREPLSQVFSAFNYYRTKYSEKYLTIPSDFHEFVSNQEEFEDADPYWSFTNNRMALDMGLPPHQLRNSSHVVPFLKDVARLFQLVLIAERFDESMILLKRRLKWTMKDVLYVSLNKRTGIRRKPPKLDPSMEVKFRRFEQFDNALYEYFFKKFDKLVREGGEDFKDEVRAYQSILRHVHQFCSLKQTGAEVLTFPRQKWTDAFLLRRSECETMTVEEMELDERARFMQQRRWGLGHRRQR